MCHHTIMKFYNISKPVHQKLTLLLRIIVEYIADRRWWELPVKPTIETTIGMCSEYPSITKVMNKLISEEFLQPKPKWQESSRISKLHITSNLDMQNMHMRIGYLPTGQWEEAKKSRNVTLLDLLKKWSWVCSGTASSPLLCILIIPQNLFQRDETSSIRLCYGTAGSFTPKLSSLKTWGSRINEITCTRT